MDFRIFGTVVRTIIRKMRIDIVIMSMLMFFYGYEHSAFIMSVPTNVDNTDVLLGSIVMGLCKKCYNMAKLENVVSQRAIPKII